LGSTDALIEAAPVRGANKIPGGAKKFPFIGIGLGMTPECFEKAANGKKNKTQKKELNTERWLKAFFDFRHSIELF
jgi:hypothetical protein